MSLLSWGMGWGGGCWSRLIGPLSQMVPFFLVTLLLKLNLHNKICSTRLPDTSTMNIVAKVGQTVLNNLQRCYCQNPNITSTQPQVNHRIVFDTNISLNHHFTTSPGSVPQHPVPNIHSKCQLCRKMRASFW